jgi:hypothetical protein
VCAGEAKTPAVNEHHAVGHAAKGNATARMGDVKLMIQSNVGKLDIAQLARDRVYPQCAIDVDAAATTTSRPERQADLVRPIARRIANAKAVTRDEIVVEQSIGIGAIEYLYAGAVTRESEPHELGSCSTCEVRACDPVVGRDLNFLALDTVSKAVKASCEKQANHCGWIRLSSDDCGKQTGPCLFKK